MGAEAPPSPKEPQPRAGSRKDERDFSTNDEDYLIVSISYLYELYSLYEHYMPMLHFGLENIIFVVRKNNQTKNNTNY